MAKARLGVHESTFQPVNIVVTLENQKELDLFGSLFNYVPICEYFQKGDGDWCEDIRKVAKEAGADINMTEELGDKFKPYRGF